MINLHEYSEENLRVDLERSALLVKQLKEKLPADGEERRLLWLVNQATFFVYLNGIKEFKEFLVQMENGPTADQLNYLRRIGVGLE